MNEAWMKPHQVGPSGVIFISSFLLWEKDLSVCGLWMFICPLSNHSYSNRRFLIYHPKSTPSVMLNDTPLIPRLHIWDPSEQDLVLFE